MHLDYVANGMGSQSMYLLYLAGTGRIPATVSFTADTGWETDCDLMDGTKTTAEDFFNTHLKPYADSLNVPAYFIRAVDKNLEPLQPLSLAQVSGEHIPLYGSNKGRRRQTCTDKWKARAMRQQARRLGAVTARSAQGILFSERARRVKGIYKGIENGFCIYKSTTIRKKVEVEVKWLSHYYPLVDLQMNRDEVRAECNRFDIPYLISSECNGCPHADKWRWLRRSPETIKKLAEIEATWNGEFFYTDARRPLAEVIAEFRNSPQSTLFDDSGFDCTGGLCGI